jgi:hypothetical protein
MDAVENIHEVVRVAGIFDSDDVAWPFRFRFLIKFEENRGSSSFTVGETVQNGEGWVVAEGPQFVQQILR